jgi:hypothetical protein
MPYREPTSAEIQAEFDRSKNIGSYAAAFTTGFRKGRTSRKAMMQTGSGRIYRALVIAWMIGAATAFHNLHTRVEAHLSPYASTGTRAGLFAGEVIFAVFWPLVIVDVEVNDWFDANMLGRLPDGATLPVDDGDNS